MDLIKFYEEVQGDYHDVIGRLLKDERILKYLIKFGQEDNYSQLISQLERKEYEEAFRSVHSVKGMCLNLGLSKLQKSASDICEELRNGAPENDLSDFLSRYKEDYDMTLEAISKLQ